MATKSQAEKKEEVAQTTADPEVVEAEEEPKDLELVVSEKMDKAACIVYRKMWYTAGVGLVPVPLVDVAGFLALQMYMTKQLADVFEVPYRQNWGKSLVYSLLASVLPVGVALPLAYGLKQIPVIGATTSAVSLSFMGAAFTYALGKVFTSHFASGGTMLSFNADDLKEQFAARYKEGQEVVAGMAAEAKA